jgi:prepilin-type N-terminal cleavage/methylation domain-containing protein
VNTRAPRGFTLIELMVSLAIAVLLLVLAMPNYGRWLADSEIQNGAQSLAGGLRFAQAEAVKRNDKIQLVLDNATGSGGWSAQLVDGTVVQDSYFAEGAARMAFDVTPAGLTTVTFNGLGMIDAANADATAPFREIDISSSVSGTHPLRILVGGTRTGIKICSTSYTWPDPKACPP